MKKGTNRVLHTISAMIFGCIALFISSIEVQAETQNSYIDFRFGQVSESNSQNNFANSVAPLDGGIKE